MAFSTSGVKGLSSEINVTPLIDVLLVLLIIFMVLVPRAPLRFDTAISLPGNSQAARQLPDPPVVVQLKAGPDGDLAHPTYFINADRTESGAVEARLRTIMDRSNRQMLVQADARLDFGIVSRIVDQGRAAGAETIGLLTPASGAMPQ